jgi:hypothetical protein
VCSGLVDDEGSSAGALVGGWESRGGLVGGRLDGFLDGDFSNEPGISGSSKLSEGDGTNKDESAGSVLDEALDPAADRCDTGEESNTACLFSLLSVWPSEGLSRSGEPSEIAAMP